MCNSGVYSREIINMFFISQMSQFVKKFKIGIYSDTINVINVKLGIMVLLTELFLVIILVTLIIFQGRSNVEHFY